MIQLKLEKGTLGDRTLTVDSRTTSSTARLSDIRHRYADSLIAYNSILANVKRQRKKHFAKKLTRIIEVYLWFSVIFKVEKFNFQNGF